MWGWWNQVGGILIEEMTQRMVGLTFRGVIMMFAWFFSQHRWVPFGIGRESWAVDKAEFEVRLGFCGV